MIAMNFLEHLVRVTTPTESFWGWVLGLGAAFLVLALVWMTVQAARASTGWKRGLYRLLLVIPLLLAGTTALLIYAQRDESGLAFLTTLGSVGVSLLVVLSVALGAGPCRAGRCSSFLQVSSSAPPLLPIRIWSSPSSSATSVRPMLPRSTGRSTSRSRASRTTIMRSCRASRKRPCCQLANPDVTDETLKLLRDFKRLKELDLNDTPHHRCGSRRVAALSTPRKVAP